MDRRGYLGIVTAVSLGGCLQFTTSSEETESEPATTAGSTDSQDPGTRTQSEGPTRTQTPESAAWPFELPAPPETGPIAADGVVYIASTDRHVYAVDAATGSETWAYETDSSDFDGLALGDGRVYVQGASNLALDASTGDLIESFESDGPMEIGENRLYTIFRDPAGNAGEQVTALDRSTLDPVWQSDVTTGYGRRLDIASNGDTVLYADVSDYVPDSADRGERTKDPRIVALDATTGEQRWQIDRRISSLDSPGISLLPLSNGIGVVTLSDGTLLGLSLETGTVQWESSYSDSGLGNVGTQPFRFGDHVGVIFDGSLSSIDASDGTRRWNVETGLRTIEGVFPQSLPVVDDVGYFVARTDGYHVVGIDTDGNVVSRATLSDGDPASESDTVAVTEDAFYYGSELALRAVSRDSV